MKMVEEKDSTGTDSAKKPEQHPSTHSKHNEDSKPEGSKHEGHHKGEDSKPEPSKHLHQKTEHHKKELHKKTVHPKEHHKAAHPKKTHHKRQLPQNLTQHLLVLGLVLLLISFINIILLSSTNSKLGGLIDENKEKTRPAVIDLLVIQDKDCSECNDAADTLETLKRFNVNVEDELITDQESQAGKLAIETYSLTTLPAIIMTGEIERLDFDESWSSLLTTTTEAQIFQPKTAPFTDLETGDVKGLVDFTIINPESCDNCRTVDDLVEQLKGLGVVEKSLSTLTYGDSEADDLISKYDIDRIPTLVVNDELQHYPEVLTLWNQLGEQRNGGYVVTTTPPPFFNITKEEVVGNVVVSIIEADCEECYNGINFHLSRLRRLGVIFEEEQFFNSSEEEGAQELIEMYDIELLPTFVLEGDLEVYPGIMQALPPFGTFNEDSTSYYFTSVEIAKEPYMNLTSGEVITP